MNEYFANVDIKMANSISMLNEEVKAPRNNIFHRATVKSLFLTPRSNDKVTSLISLVRQQKSYKKE